MESPGQSFNDQAQAYAAFRPTYPTLLYEKIQSYAGPQAEHNLAIDIACGSGQAAVELAKRYHKVIATDPSKGQLQHALMRPNISYQEGTAEQINAVDHTADLLVSAQAIHWFDLAKFYKEAHRTLKAGGVLAVWGATLPMVEGNSSATQLIIDFAHKKEYLGDCWDERASIVHTEYKDVHPDQTLFKEEQRVSVTTVAESSFASLVGLLSSWSAYGKYRKRFPDRQDPLEKLKPRLKTACKIDSDDSLVKVEHLVFMVMAKAKG